MKIIKIFGFFVVFVFVLIFVFVVDKFDWLESFIVGIGF